MTFNDFQYELNEKIKTSKHHCYGMFNEMFVEDFGFGKDTFENVGNLHIVYKDKQKQNILLNKNEIKKAENFVEYLINKKVIVKPDDVFNKIKQDINNQLFVSEVEYEKIPKNQKERSSDFHKCKNGYFIQKDKIDNYYIPGAYNIRYKIENRLLNENDLIHYFSM